MPGVTITRASRRFITELKDKMYSKFKMEREDIGADSNDLYQQISLAQYYQEQRLLDTWN
jgi:hypothetical protein